jgi:hypothetical protein
VKTVVTCHNEIDSLFDSKIESATRGLRPDANRYLQSISIPNAPIISLLRKPWNPYIRRHSALTEKSVFLKEHVLRQHAGWSPRSQMHLKYLHYFGNESSESILEAYGIIAKEDKNSNCLRSKQCPNCNEPNKPDSRFCAKCRLVLSYDAYNETFEEQKIKEDKLTVMENKFNAMQLQMQSLLTIMSSINNGEQKREIAKRLIEEGIYKP